MIHSDLLALRISQAGQVTGSVFQPISHIEASQLEAALISDVISLAQIAMASLVEGIAGISDYRFSWAKVKLYYSGFYSVRAMLMLHKIAIFYIGRSPFTLEAKPGESAKKRAGNSHTVAFELFRQNYKNDLVLSQQISGLCPLKWIEDKRSEISYRTAPYVDPESPSEFSSIIGKERLHVQEYCCDDLHLYAFDPDHSMLAYPILLVKRLSELVRNYNINEIVDINVHYRDILVKSNCFVPAMRVKFPLYNFK